MIDIDEAINRKAERNDTPLEQSGGISIDEAIDAIENRQPQNRAWINNPIHDTVGAFGVGLASMANDTLLGGISLGLADAGYGIEQISPFSGRDDKAVRELLSIGIPLKRAKEILGL